VDSTLIATAISELARNIVSYAKTGEILLTTLQESRRKGILIVASDHGPGIPIFASLSATVFPLRAAWVSASPASEGSSTNFKLFLPSVKAQW